MPHVILSADCTDERRMVRELGAQVAKALKLRVAELQRVREFPDLLAGTGAGNRSQRTARDNGQPG